LFENRNLSYPLYITMEYKKLSYRKQSARQLRTQYVEGTYMPRRRTV